MGLLSNARWVALSQGVRIASQVIGMVVLARLVSPAEYGVMAMATVITNFAMIFRDMGSSAAIIQRVNLDDGIKNAVFWFNLGIGIFIALIIILLSPLIATLFHEARLRYILVIIAFAFPLSSSGAVHQALLEKESDFRVVAKIEVLSTLIGLVAAVGMGWAGAGVYSLVAQTLITMGLASFQLWFTSGWRPSSVKLFKWTDLSSILGFSSNLVGFNIVNYFSRNADNIIIGHYFSAAILGAYSLAYRIMLFPLQSLTFVVSRSLYPLLAKQQGDVGVMKATYLDVVAVVATVVAPMMGGMFVMRDVFIGAILGKGWGLSASLLLWLAPTGFIQSILSTTGVVFMAKGATRQLMWLGMGGAALQVSSFMIGLHGGVNLMVKWYFLANVINAIPVLFFCMHILRGRIWDLIIVIWAPVVSTLLMVLILRLLLMGAESGYSWLVLIVGTIGGIVIYLAGYLALGYGRLKKIIFLLRPR